MTTATQQPEANVTKKQEGKKKVATKSPQQFVTKEEFSQLTDVLSTLVSAVTELKNKPTTPQAVKESEEVARARHDQAPLNPAWDEKAREIVGEAVDHCEVFYPRNGGTIFTIVIKPEFSNAPKEYIAAMKMDRRSREIGPEGISGVENWAKLVRANLKRAR